MEEVTKLLASEDKELCGRNRDGVLRARLLAKHTVSAEKVAARYPRNREAASIVECALHLDRATSNDEEAAGWVVLMIDHLTTRVPTALQQSKSVALLLFANGSKYRQRRQGFRLLTGQEGASAGTYGHCHLSTTLSRRRSSVRVAPHRHRALIRGYMPFFTTST